MKRSLLCVLLLPVVALLPLLGSPMTAQPLFADTPRDTLFLPLVSRPGPVEHQVPSEDRMSFFGMNTYFTGLERIPPWNYDGEQGIATLIGMGREAGISWAREEISWGNIERHYQAENREWYLFDDRLRQVNEAGYNIIGMIATTPEWARVADCDQRITRYADVSPTVPESYWCPPADVQDYAEIVRATVERYDGDGISDAPGSPRVAVWQMWNEPNAWETWPGTPEEYGRLLLAGYNAAKEADPTSVVTAGGVYVFDGSWNDGKGHRDGLSFMSDVLAAVPEAWQAIDVLPVHPYMPDRAPDEPGLFPQVTMWGRIVTSRSWLEEKTQQYGGEVPQLWIGEVGWPTLAAIAPARTMAASPDLARYRLPTPGVYDEPELLADTWQWHSQQEQANYMVRTHAIALAHGVEHLNYLQLEDKFDGAYYPAWGATSIIGTREQGYAPRTAYHAYRVMVEQLEGAQFAGLGQLHSYVYNPTEHATPAARYHIRMRIDARTTVDIIWRSGPGYQADVTLDPGHTAELIALDGTRTPLQAQDGKVSFVIGEEPVYLRQWLP
jgi:hypothetical protein